LNAGTVAVSKVGGFGPSGFGPGTVVQHGFVVDRPDADPASGESRPELTPVSDLLEADQFPTDLLGV
jgi:hypothetical protein